MDIGRTEGVQGPNPVRGPKPVSKAPPPPESASVPTDKVEISDVAKLTSEVASLPAVRQERVEEIKKLIQEGRFETPERFEGAIDEFLRQNGDAL